MDNESESKTTSKIKFEINKYINCNVNKNYFLNGYKVQLYFIEIKSRSFIARAKRELIEMK